MKRILIYLSLVLCATGLSAQNTLTLTLADGTQHVLLLSERPELLWEGGNIIISAGNTELCIPRLHSSY